MAVRPSVPLCPLLVAAAVCACGEYTATRTADENVVSMGGSKGTDKTSQAGAAAAVTSVSATLGGNGQGGNDSLTGSTATGGATGAVDEMLTVRLDTSVRYQKLVGFGASIAWYDGWLTQHPKKDEIYQLIFGDLGIDLLRLRNRHQRDTEFDPSVEELVQRASTSLNRRPALLMSSWSPPANLKASGKVDCAGEVACTLARDENGFVYDGFADYWSDSLDAYAARGIVPDYVSIQNEPDYTPNGWEGCRFAPTETDSYPGYDKALARVHARLSQRSMVPKLLGPEVISVFSNRIQDYAGLDSSLLDGLAHHLYSGDMWLYPDEYVPYFRAINPAYPDKPVFQTEFSVPELQGAFETAWLIFNSLTEENAVAYLYWNLIWSTAGGLVSLEYPGNTTNWQTTSGYLIRDDYYYFKQFSAFTDPEYVRVSAISNGFDVRSTAFLSPDEAHLTAVILNVGAESHAVYLKTDGLSIASSAVYRTSADEHFANLGPLPDNSAVVLPSRSIATVSIRLEM